MSERWGCPLPEAGGELIIKRCVWREALAEPCEVGA
ncbi:hypothetical protein P3T35_004398 [Kitasatospora sp. GP30]|nr:hypothetical protein [Kitasatospora sp. GP30]